MTTIAIVNVNLVSLSDVNVSDIVKEAVTFFQGDASLSYIKCGAVIVEYKLRLTTTLQFVELGIPGYSH